MHLAAESHVERCITGAGNFVQTNIVGTFSLLEAARAHWSGLDAEAKAAFHFLHVSTDEVYGSLGPDGLFEETTPYDPSSRYSASKAVSDHLAPGLDADLRPAGRHLELLQQLRAVPFSGKADPARHAERVGRGAAAGLRPRRQHPRLALR